MQQMKFCNIHETHCGSTLVSYTRLQDRIIDKTKYIFLFQVAAMFFISYYAKNYYTKFCTFLKIYNHVSLYGPTESGTNANPTSLVCSPTTSELPTIQNHKLQF